MENQDTVEVQEGAIIEIGRAQERPDPQTLLRTRLLNVVRSGCRDAAGNWLHNSRPGACPWWLARQLVGGRTRAALFRQAVDQLLAEGELLEVWLERRDGREAPHILLLPGHSHQLQAPVTRARGRPDVLAREPWAAQVAADAG